MWVWNPKVEWSHLRKMWLQRRKDETGCDLWNVSLAFVSLSMGVFHIDQCVWRSRFSQWCHRRTVFGSSKNLSVKRPFVLVWSTFESSKEPWNIPWMLKVLDGTIDSTEEPLYFNIHTSVCFKLALNYSPASVSVSDEQDGVGSCKVGQVEAGWCHCSFGPWGVWKEDMRTLRDVSSLPAHTCTH